MNLSVSLNMYGTFRVSIFGAIIVTAKPKMSFIVKCFRDFLSCNSL